MGAGAVDELRVLFNRGDLEGVVARSEQLLHRNRSGYTGSERYVIVVAQAAACLHLGKTRQAGSLLDELESATDLGDAASIVPTFLAAARPYFAWSTNEGVDAALEREEKGVDGGAGSLSPERATLRAQLQYRAGRYADAADTYRGLFDEKRKQLQAANQRGGETSRSWSLSAFRSSGTSPVLSPNEIAALEQSIDEIGTNLMAALVLASKSKEAMDVRSSLGNGYEVEYNAGCAAIASCEWDRARQAISAAEDMFRNGFEEDETDLAKSLAPILVQRAYLTHLSGDLEAAERQYVGILKERSADAASLAVAANNAAVATGQIALNKQHIESMSKLGQAHRAGEGIVEKPVIGNADRHSDLFDGLKKMKATSGRDVERKLTHRQRRTMARNRAILLLQMNRYDACRVELDSLRGHDADDPALPLIEAAVLAKTQTFEDADALLQGSHCRDTPAAKGARVSLALQSERSDEAIELLLELFPDTAAGIATTVSVMESCGKTDRAVSLLEKYAGSNPMHSLAAKRRLAALFIEAEQYQKAVQAANDALEAQPGDEAALGMLVFAQSFCDASQAERLADQLPALDSEREVNAEALEAQPPPRKRTNTRDGAGAQTEATSATASTAGGATTPRRSKPPAKRKRKKILPKNYDPNGPPPDPERWLPKTLRSSYKKTRKGRADASFRGSQGADAAAAEAAATKNAQRSAARAAESESARTNETAVPKGTKSKKKNRRR